MNFFFVRPRNSNDRVTNALFSFSSKIIQDILKFYPDAELTDLAGERVTRANLEQILQNKQFPKGSIFVFYGHGKMNCLLGCDKKEVLIDDNNMEILKDWSVYVVACHSMSKLGPDCVLAGAESYIGYNEVYVVNFKSGGVIPDGFEQAANAGLQYMIANRKYDIVEVYNAIRETYRYWIFHYLGTSFQMALTDLSPGEFGLTETKEIARTAQIDLGTVVTLNLNMGKLDYRPKS